MFSLQGGNGPNRAPGVRAPGALAVGVGTSGSPRPARTDSAGAGPDGRGRQPTQQEPPRRLEEKWTELPHRRRQPVHHGDAQRCR